MDRARQGNRDSERQTSCASSHVTVLASDCKYMDQRSKEGVREATKGGVLREVVGRMTEQSGRGNSGANMFGLEGGQERRAGLSSECGCPELPKMCVKTACGSLLFCKPIKNI